jgi:hypothetical protein
MWQSWKQIPLTTPVRTRSGRVVKRKTMDEPNSDAVAVDVATELRPLFSGDASRLIFEYYIDTKAATCVYLSTVADAMPRLIRSFPC